MLKYLNQYVSDFEKELNVSLMNKEADRPLVEYIKEAWLSLEIVKNIKILKFEYSDNESDIDINKYIFKREKKKKKKDRVDYKFINDDRYGCLTVYIQITLKEEDPHSKEPVIHQKIIKKQMLIPLQDEEGYFFIRGKKYYLLYQLVEKSTYTTSSSVVLKSLMPISVKRTSINVEAFQKNSTSIFDSNGIEYTLPIYNVFVFRKEIPIILFFFANGMDYALSFLGVDNILRFVESMDDANEEKNLYFPISSKLFIEVNREIFLKYAYIQSIVGATMYVCTNRLTMADLYDRTTWIKKLSNNNTIEKGEDILVFFTRLLDKTTKEILLLNEFNKEDIYAVLRWVNKHSSRKTSLIAGNSHVDNQQPRLNMSKVQRLGKGYLISRTE